mmetsp:Transcript_92666/g.235632  ORF Transcript_92666/g.235632 Transcript_92666/m.235632 type:complete len:204 (-) Transcript_92666:61-672(-)
MLGRGDRHRADDRQRGHIVEVQRQVWWQRDRRTVHQSSRRAVGETSDGMSETKTACRFDLAMVAKRPPEDVRRRPAREEAVPCVACGQAAAIPCRRCGDAEQRGVAHRRDPGSLGGALLGGPAPSASGRPGRKPVLQREQRRDSRVRRDRQASPILDIAEAAPNQGTPTSSAASADGGRGRGLAQAAERIGLPGLAQPRDGGR